jgi:hypothetical protein
VVGSTREWVVGASLLAATFLSSPFLTRLLDSRPRDPRLFLTGWVTLVAIGVAVAASAGALAPTVLDRARGRVPLPLLAAGQVAVGAGGGATIATLALAVAPALGIEAHPPSLPVLVGSTGLMGGGTVAAWWLPFTVATVTGRRGWLVSVVSGPLAWLVIEAIGR